MKKTIILATVALLACFGVQAQTNPQTVQSFAVSFEQYMTSFNTNYSFTNVTIEVATGYKQVTGIGAASTLDGQYDIGNFNLGLGLQFSGVGSAINAGVGQIGYAIVNHYDTKVDVDLRAGYDLVRKCGVVEPAIFLEKKMTPNTFTRVGASMPIYTSGPQSTTPTFYVEAGFTY
jgi:hypothetical protein